MFDYDAAAELYFGHPNARTRRKVGYRRFPRAATAIQFAAEQLAPAARDSAFLEVNDARFNAAEIRELYEHTDFPLARRAAQ
jgi:hypothetical protein